MRQLARALVAGATLAIALACAAPASAQYNPDNWKRVDFKVNSQACGDVVSCTFQEEGLLKISLDYEPSYGGGHIGTWQCSIDIEASLDGDGTIDIADMEWSGGGPSSPCDTADIGDLPAEGQACYSIPNDAYYARVPLSIQGAGLPPEWSDGVVFGRIDIVGGDSWGIVFGNEAVTTPIRFPSNSSGILWSIDEGWLALDQAVQSSASQSPCPWPELT